MSNRSYEASPTRLSENHPRRRSWSFCLTVLVFLGLTNAVASATTINVSGGGTLTFSNYFNQVSCGHSDNPHYSADYNEYTNFSYSLSPVTNASAIATYKGDGFTSCGIPAGGSPAILVLKLQNGCAVNFVPTSPMTATLSCVGTPVFISPKYVIVGVTYAPPGPSSYVQYTAGTVLGTTTSLSNSFASATSVTASVTTGASLFGFFKGSITSTASAAYTQTSNNASSITISQQSQFSNKIGGTPLPYSPVNHDYDLVWLWLNPVLTFTVYPPPFQSVAWNGYAFDEADQPALDIWPVAVGYLNGHFGALDPGDATVLARSWASAGQTFPAGQGPGLTTTDLRNIAAADPYANPNYLLTLSSTASPATTTDGRFTISRAAGTAAQAFIYKQASPGNPATTQTLTNTYSMANTTSQSTTYNTQVGFGIEASVATSAAGLAAFSADLKLNQTLTWTHQAGTSTSSTASQIDMLSITGPPCVATTTPCVPTYTGPSEFDVYQDNLFGTFMFYPVQ